MSTANPPTAPVPTAAPANPAAAQPAAVDVAAMGKYASECFKMLHELDPSEDTTKVKKLVQGIAGIYATQGKDAAEEMFKQYHQSFQVAHELNTVMGSMAAAKANENPTKPEPDLVGIDKFVHYIRNVNPEQALVLGRLTKGFPLIGVIGNAMESLGTLDLTLKQISGKNESQLFPALAKLISGTNDRLKENGIELDKMKAGIGPAIERVKELLGAPHTASGASPAATPAQTLSTAKSKS